MNYGQGLLTARTLYESVFKTAAKDLKDTTLL